MNQDKPSHASPPYFPPHPQPPHPHPQPPPPYPHPEPPPPPPPPMQQRTVIIPGIAFSKNTQHLICPYCHADISTRVETGANTKTHLFALLLCVIGCWCCAPIPYCMESCQVQRHYCPSCKAYLGSSEN